MLILAEALALESSGRKDNELAYAIRTLVSEGQIKYQTTGYVDKKLVTILKTIAGPTSLVTTTIKGKLEDQLDDRMITAHPNTSALQTRDIIGQTADMAAGTVNLVDDITIKAYQHYHDSLVAAEVVIPFAKEIATFVSQGGSLPVSARRSFKRFLSAIKTITLLYQKQRSKDGQGRFIADYSDYFIAYQLLEESFAESLGEVKRYTDDRIRIIETVGMMTPRDLAKRTGVSTAAISQWSKGMMEKGVLGWCDENGTVFGDDLALEKAKRSGKAFLNVAGGNSLPSPFQLTGDPRWDKGGDLYAAYDLELDHVCGEDENSEHKFETVAGKEDFGVDDVANSTNEASAVKVLSGKSNDEIKKVLQKFRETKPPGDIDDSLGDQLFNEFSDILSTERIGAAH